MQQRLVLCSRFVLLNAQQTGQWLGHLHPLVTELMIDHQLDLKFGRILLHLRMSFHLTDSFSDYVAHGSPPGYHSLLEDSL